MDAQKQIIERLKQANNVLVTVTNNPSVDQLAALLGFGLALTKLDKHATAVYSGETPSTIEFLRPAETIEKNTDSLRDFIISLDKSKADKLRYKVEDSVVRIFITPYRTSISDTDLEFSQGDFNVDAVIALGVHTQKDLDQAITAHGRIFHDATVITINNNDQVAELGSINWINSSASSISEMITMLIMVLGNDIFDEQIATALLTGIVAETERFGNDKTSANTMKASAVLMSAGANPELVATKIEEARKASSPFDDDSTTPTAGGGDEAEEEKPATASADGTLKISHEHDEEDDEKQDLAPEPDQPIPVLPEVQEPEAAVEPEPEITLEDITNASDRPEDAIDKLLMPAQETAKLPAIGKAHATGESADFEAGQGKTLSHQKIMEEPTFPVYDTNIDTGAEDEFIDPMGTSDKKEEDSVPVLTHNVESLDEQLQQITPATQEPQVIEPVLPPVVSPTTQLPSIAPLPRPGETLSELEQDLHSPHVVERSYDELDLSALKHPDGSEGPAVTVSDSVDDARDAVSRAMDGLKDKPLEPIIALNAQPLGEPLRDNQPVYSPLATPSSTEAPQQSTEQSVPLPTPQYIPTPLPPTYPTQPSQPTYPPSPTAPPPVPPPIMPPFPQ